MPAALAARQITDLWPPTPTNSSAPAAAKPPLPGFAWPPAAAKSPSTAARWKIISPLDTLRSTVTQPLTLTGTADKLDVRVNVTGGGPNGQAGATRHGISRALLKFDANLRPQLKAEGFLTRDPRERERKKYGQPGARKRFQFSKR